MFQLVNSLLSVQTSPVLGNTLSLKIDGDRSGPALTDTSLPQYTEGTE